jgi:hypothetical protein
LIGEFGSTSSGTGGGNTEYRYLLPMVVVTRYQRRNAISTIDQHLLQVQIFSHNLFFYWLDAPAHKMVAIEIVIPIL